jgi:hypothetical protein
MSELRTHATGTIEVTGWDPSPYDEQDGASTLVRIEVTEIFHGDLEGRGHAQMLQALRPDGSADFVGHERVTATLGDREGTFIFQDAGTLAVSGTVAGTWFVVPGSGTAGLAGLRGEGTFTADVGASAAITLDYWFE